MGILLIHILVETLKVNVYRILYAKILTLNILHRNFRHVINLIFCENEFLTTYNAIYLHRIYNNSICVMLLNLSEKLWQII